jgi:hypothetical protein
VATDGGTPALTDTATVTVAVECNLNSPQFTTTTYNKAIYETQIPGVGFLPLIANDNDAAVSITREHLKNFFCHKFSFT